MSEKLVFKRIKRPPLPAEGQTVIKIDNESYNKVVEVADETGKSLKDVVSQMVEYAYKSVVYESE